MGKKISKKGNKVESEFTWIQIITIVMATIAIAISIWSLKISHEANIISKDSLENSKKTFIKEQRPRLQLKPAKHKGIALQCRLMGNKIIFTVNINMKNNGKITANNIVVLQDSMRIVITNNEIDFKNSENPIVATSLSPDQDYNLERELIFTRDDPNSIKDILTSWKKGKLYVFADINIKHTDLSSENEYTVFGKYKLSIYKDIIIDYKDL